MLAKLKAFFNTVSVLVLSEFTLPFFRFYFFFFCEIPQFIFSYYGFHFPVHSPVFKNMLQTVYFETILIE